MVYLIKGEFYGLYNKKGKLIEIYLVGDKVPCISNVFVCKIYKDGRMSDNIDAFYYRQNTNFKLIKDNIPKIKSSYRRHLQHLMSNRYLYIKDNNDLPNVDRYLDNPKEFIKQQPTNRIRISEDIRTGKYYLNKN